jgi:DHA2 family multidrug resistance protein
MVLIEMPIVGQLTTRVPVRYIIATGWLALALAMGYSALRMNLLISFGAATWIRIVQVLGIGFLFVPITLAAYIGVPSEKSNSVAGMINFMRNIGSSIGTSLVTTVIARRSQFHQVHLVSRIATDNPGFTDEVRGIAHGLARDGLTTYEAQRQAVARLYHVVQGQAQALAYVDAFWILAALAAVMCCLSFLLKRNDPRAGGGMAVG